MPEPARLTLAFHSLDYPPASFVSSIGLYTRQLAAALARRGHRVHVVSRGERDSLEQDGPVSVHKLSPPRPGIPRRMNVVTASMLAATGLEAEWRFRRRLARKLAELVEDEGVNLVEGTDTAAEALLYRADRHPRVPFVVRLHGPTAVAELFDRNIPEFGRRLIRHAERSMFLRATHLTAPSRMSAELYRRELALGDRPITVFPNIPTFDPADLSAAGKAQAPDPNLVLYVGRLTAQKGVHFLVKAVPGVLEARPETRFVFVGPDGPSGRGHSSFRAYLLSLLPERYHRALEFTGYKTPEEVKPYYRRAALCALPSLFESFGYTCLEAMMHGKAVIGSPTGGMVDMLEGGRCGLLYTPPDVRELERHILTLLQDAPLRQRLGDAARARVASHYHPDLIAGDVEAFYYRAVGDLAASRR